MWRLTKLIFTLTVLLGGMLAGVYFVNANPAMVNVQFPISGRESGPAPLGIALLAAGAVGMAVAMVLAFLVSVAMTLNAQKLKREIRALKREVDALRNLPLLEEELDDEDEEEEEVRAFDDTDVLDQPPVGPVRSGSTVAPVGGDDDDEDSVSGPMLGDDDDDEDDDIGDEDDEDLVSTRPAGRKIDVP